MSKKQLAALFMNYLVVSIYGAVTANLLPIYATRLGADSTLTGLYISSTFAALAVGISVAGWLSDKLQRRKTILLGAGALQVVAIFLMSQAGTMAQLFVFSILSFTLSGVQIAMANALTGLFAKEEERGRIFGILTSSNPLGALLGGLTSGFIVDRWGFPGLFVAAALVMILGPVTGLLLEDKQIDTIRGRTASTAAQNPFSSLTFLLLFFATTIIFAGIGVQGLGKSLLMDKLGFDASAVSSTLAVGGLVGLPFPFFLGWLSDRVGRKPLLLISYFLMVGSLIMLTQSVVLWHFWVSTALLWIVIGSVGVGSALVTDIVPPEAIGAGLALFGATNFIGLVIGNAGAGAAFQNLGMIPTFVIGALLSVVAVVLVVRIRQPIHKIVG